MAARSIQHEKTVIFCKFWLVNATLESVLLLVWIVTVEVNKHSNGINLDFNISK